MTKRNFCALPDANKIVYINIGKIIDLEYRGSSNKIRLEDDKQWFIPVDDSAHAKKTINELLGLDEEQIDRDEYFRLKKKVAALEVQIALLEEDKERIKSYSYDQGQKMAKEQRKHAKEIEEYATEIQRLDNIIKYGGEGTLAISDKASGGALSIFRKKK